MKILGRLKLTLKNLFLKVIANFFFRLSEISTNKRAPADKTENGADLDPQMSSSVATRFSDLFIKDWATAYKVLSSVVKNDRKVTYLLLQCLMVRKMMIIFQHHFLFINQIKNKKLHSKHIFIKLKKNHSIRSTSTIYK